MRINVSKISEFKFKKISFISKKNWVVIPGKFSNLELILTHYRNSAYSYSC